MRTRVLPVLLIATLLLLLLPAVVQALTYDQAVDKLVKAGWPQTIEKKLVSFQSSSLGFRAGGTPADDAQARYIAAQMKLVGLSNVRLEPVPVDEWNFSSASVAFNSATVPASSFGGVVATPMGGVTAPVVYVHGGSAAEFDLAGDVTGKIVLVDFESPMWWMSYPAMEAGYRHAAAIILTHSDNTDFFGYYDQQNALGCFDAETQLSAPPMVYISWKNGDLLKTALQAGPVSATVKNNVTQRLADDGGMGYNVIGQIRGTRNPAQMVLVGSHHDAWFKGGLDNASAVVNSLLTAKAMKMSGYQPKRTIVFFSSTAEEYGYTQSYYDWCIGAWYSITQAHPGWAGRISAMLNSELLGYKAGNLWMLASPEVTPAIDATLAASGDLTLTKNATAAAVIGAPWCWNDQWTFTAAGVPSVSFWSQDNDYSGVVKTTMYHTQYDTPSLIDYTFLGAINKFEFRVAKKFAGGSSLLPYDFGARATDLKAALDSPADANIVPDYTYGMALGDYADQATNDAFTNAVSRFSQATDEYGYAVGANLIPHADYPSVNVRLMNVNKIINTAMTGMDWLDNTVYPFQQTASDIFRMDQAIQAINYGAQDWQDEASRDVGSVGLMWYGTNFSHQVFLKELQRHRQSYYRICWGGQGHLAKYQDLTAAYAAILGGDPDTAASILQGKLDAQITDLDQRLADMTSALNEAADQLEDVTPPMDMQP